MMIMMIAASTVLVLLSILSSAQGCLCPSCHYTNAAQNCQCCVYRQLGKRADPGDLLTYDLPEALPQSLQYQDDDLANVDWSSPKRSSGVMTGDVTATRLQRGAGGKVALANRRGRKEGMVGFGRKMKMLLRGLNHVLKMATALEAAMEAE